MVWYHWCNAVTQVTSTTCLSLIPLCSLLFFLPGTIHAIFEKSNNHYTWKKVTTTVHNIIVGKLWIDQVSDTLWRLQINLLPHVFTSISFFFCLSPVGGDRRGESHYWRPLPPEVCTLQLLLQRRGQEGEGTHRFNISLLIFSVLCTNLNCALLPFCNSGWLISSSSLQVTGVVMDKDGKAHYVLSGTWDEKLEFSRVMQSSRGGENGTEGKQKTVYQTLKAREVWRRNPLP